MSEFDMYANRYSRWGQIALRGPSRSRLESQMIRFAHRPLDEQREIALPTNSVNPRSGRSP